MLTKLVGLIAFASPDKSSITAMYITIIYSHLLNSLSREQSCCRDKVHGAIVRRAVVMVFASSYATVAGFSGINIAKGTKFPIELMHNDPIAQKMVEKIILIKRRFQQ